jgi:hypothetical protein
MPRPNRRAEGRPCPYCRAPMTRNHQHRRPSNDHILPASWGGPDDLENYRVCCSGCNGLRALAGHCVAALACARAVARTNRTHTLDVLNRWKLPIPDPPSL